MKVEENKTGQQQTVRAGINEKIFFEKMGHLFADSFSVLGELMQNARRAGASKVAFVLNEDKNTLTIEDDGHGIQDFSSLIRMCESSWGESVTIEDKPFGMGLFATFFAGETVEFRSQGKVLSLTLDDVANKRPIAVLDDPTISGRGTLVRITGLNSKFIGRDRVTKPNVSPTCQRKLERFARGFPIPVLFNGVALPRPYAIDQKKFELTEIGHVHCPGVHATEQPLNQSSCTAALFLQGLPINEVQSTYDGDTAEGRTIVHLDSAQFQAKMPDREKLFDGDGQVKKLGVAVNNLVKRFLISEKETLSGEDFVKKHFLHSLTFEVPHLLNDIPWLPKSAFAKVDEVSVSQDDDAWSNFDLTGRRGDALIARQAFLEHSVIAWRDVPNGAHDDAEAGMAMKLMQQHNVIALSADVDDGHWIHQVTPSYDNMTFVVTPLNPASESDTYRYNDVALEFRFCDSVEVAVNDGNGYAQTFAITGEWLPVPAATKAGDHSHYDCYVAREATFSEHPALFLSSFTDGDDHWREEWQQDASDDIDQILANLRGQTLGELINRILIDKYPSLNPRHKEQLALTTVVHEKHYRNPRTVTIAMDDEFMVAVAAALGSGITSADLFAAVKDAAAAVGEK